MLAVHPDTTLRQYVFDKMSRAWIPLPVEARHWTIASLIRSNQHELALEEMNHLEKYHNSSGNADSVDNSPIPLWIYTLLLHALTDQRDFRAVMQLLYRLHDSRIHISQWTSLHILTIAAAQNDYDITAWLWRRVVEKMEIDPSVPLCESVLRLAAKHGQIWLAESAVAMLEIKFKSSESTAERENEGQIQSQNSTLSTPTTKEQKATDTISDSQKFIEVTTTTPNSQNVNPHGLSSLHLALLSQAHANSTVPPEKQPKKWRRGNLWPVFRDESGMGLSKAWVDAKTVVRRAELETRKRQQQTGERLVDGHEQRFEAGAGAGAGFDEWERPGRDGGGDGRRGRD